MNPATAPVLRYHMPHEGERQARTWMTWPAASYMLDGSIVSADSVWNAWASVANAISGYQAVTVLVSPEHAASARRHLSAAVEQLVARVDDAWMRDSGPTFVRDAERGGALTAVSWEFNAWGGLELAATQADNRIAATLAERTGATLLSSPMVNEGGGIHVDGAGTVLVTETVQLDPRRNPGWSRASVEAELARTIGARHAIWLERGLFRDYGPLGTRGHVDMVATFSAPGTVLLHAQRDPAHPDYPLSRALRAQCERETDANGWPLSVVELPAPETLRDRHGWVDYGYVNHALVNGAVIACAFDDPADADAAAILRDAYPGREVIGIDARSIFALGGGIHCITQQQPLIPGTSARSVAPARPSR
ncbi:MAG: agmatine/peptidylarginine deiminase [Leucobacter sp.]